MNFWMFSCTKRPQQTTYMELNNGNSQTQITNMNLGEELNFRCLPHINYKEEVQTIKQSVNPHDKEETIIPWLVTSQVVFFFLISNKLYWYQKKDTLAHRECTGVNNQELKLQESRKMKREENDWSCKTDSQSNKVLKKKA